MKMLYFPVHIWNIRSSFTKATVESTSVPLPPGLLHQYSRSGSSSPRYGLQFIQPKHLHQHHFGVARRLHPMPDRPLVLEDLVVVAALLGAIAEEVDLLELGRPVARHMAQRVRLVPAAREHIEADLAADAVRQVHLGELGAQARNHLLAHAVLAVVRMERVALVARALAPDRAHVQHAVAELDEGAALHRQLQLGQVAQHEVDEALQRRLAQVRGDRLLAHLDALLDLHQPVLREDVVEAVEDRAPVQLLEHLLQVGAAHDADGGARPDVRVQEELERGRDVGARRGQRAVHVEQQQDVGAGEVRDGRAALLARQLRGIDGDWRKE